MPASSPGDTSNISAWNFFLSAQRMYIRISICAQSCDSVPPAPAWNARITSLESYGPSNINWTSIASNLETSMSISWCISSLRDSSFSARAIPIISCRSAALDAICCQVVIVSFRAPICRIVDWAFCESAQKSGSDVFASKPASPFSFPAMSKMLHYRRDPALKFVYPGFLFLHNSSWCLLFTAGPAYRQRYLSSRCQMRLTGWFGQS